MLDLFLLFSIYILSLKNWFSIKFIEEFFLFTNTYRRRKSRCNWLYCTLPVIAAFAIMLISIATDVNNIDQNINLAFHQRSILHVSSISFIVLLHSLSERLTMVNSHLRYYWKAFMSSTIIVEHLNLMFFVFFICPNFFVFIRTIEVIPYRTWLKIIDLKSENAVI